MDMLIIVSNSESGPLASALALAAERANASWAVFFTNDGVRILADDRFVAAMQGAQNAVACHESWQTHMAEKPCPIEEGSQTNNSALVAQAARIISL